MISPECFRMYMTPYKILEYEVALSANKPDKFQEVKFGEKSEILRIRKFSDYHSEYYVLVKGNMMGKSFVIGEIYKFYTNLVDSNLSMDLFEILRIFFEKVGVEFTFSGIKSKFLYKSKISIDLPPMDVESHLTRLAEYLLPYYNKEESGHSRDESMKLYAIPKFIEGNYVHFMTFDLLYALNHFKYTGYLNESN